ncbi:hypothetical protein [Paraburkholderia ferrariae]|uniref:AAA domain-containing protein n=1 Tax=Paraburkholderia ferrariae TaxID=386056 RepID=A0ABU9RYW3_9BURK
MDAKQVKKVTVIVNGPVGSGKSAICGEIEIMCRALGLPVVWLDGQQEKNLTHADWTDALEMYKPSVEIVERIENAALASDAAGEPVAWAVYNGVARIAFYMSEEGATDHAKAAQRSHDLSGSLAAFHVKPLYAAPVAPAAVAPSKQSHEWDDEGDHCTQCGDPAWCADTYCTPKAQPDERAAYIGRSVNRRASRCARR